MALTTPNLTTFLRSLEEFRPKAYDDFQPHLDLNPGDEDRVRGTLTYGDGFTRRPDGAPVQLGDTITEQESLDRLAKYIRDEIEPVIENLIHVPITGGMADALGSLIFNFGADEIAGWNLIKRINRADPPEAIAEEWLDRTYSSKGENMLGLYRRRIMEVLMAFGLDWRAGAAITWSNKVLDVMKVLGWDGKMPVAHIETVDAVLFDDDDLTIPKRGAVESQPKPVETAVQTPPEWNELTDAQKTAFLNNGQLKDLGGKPKVAITPVTQRVPLESYEYLDDEQKKAPMVKDVRKSQRGKSVGKRAISKSTGAAGVGGVVAIATGTAEPVLAIVDKYPKQTLAYVAVILIVVAVVFHFWSEWQLQKGRDEAEDFLG